MIFDYKYIIKMISLQGSTFYNTLPEDIIEYVSKNIYKEFSNKVKTNCQIKQDAIFATKLQDRLIFLNNYNININNFISPNIDGVNLIQEDFNIITSHYNNNVNNNIINNNFIYSNIDGVNLVQEDFNIITSHYNNNVNNNIIYNDSDTDPEMPELEPMHQDTL